MSEKYQVWTREGHQELSEGGWWNFDRSLLHRVDDPAVIYPSGTKYWYQNGQLHRTDGPAVIYLSGTQYWYQNDQRHRTDGPAWIHPDGPQWWYLNGQLHRVDGPAQIFPDGDQYWYLNDRRLPKNEVESWINTNGIDLNRLEDQLMFLTEWGP